MLTAAVVVLVVIACCSMVRLFACGGSFAGYDEQAQSGQAPYKSNDQVERELGHGIGEGMFNISIVSNIQFEDSSSSGVAYIENVPNNSYDMQVSIVDDATGDMLYESGVLRPNEYIESIVLDKPLSAGSYSATATFTALDKVTHAEEGKASGKVVIDVLN